MSKEGFSLSDTRYVKRITVGSINPNVVIAETTRDEQLKLLNRCLDEGRGKIIGKDVTYGVYQIGEHEITLQATTYHVGFKRKPYWMED